MVVRYVSDALAMIALETCWILSEHDYLAGPGLEFGHLVTVFCPEMLNVGPEEVVLPKSVHVQSQRNSMMLICL